MGTSKKVEFGVMRRALEIDAGDWIPVIVRVAVAEYVPAGFRVRMRLTPEIFTADVQPAALRHIDGDDQVISIGGAGSIRPG